VNPNKRILWRINSHCFNNVSSRFLSSGKSNKLCFNYCRSFYVKLAFFTVFVLTLQTDFAARCCFWFSPIAFLLNKFAHPWYSTNNNDLAKSSHVYFDTLRIILDPFPIGNEVSCEFMQGSAFQPLLLTIVCGTRQKYLRYEKQKMSSLVNGQGNELVF